MFGIILAVIGTFFGEISTAFGKWEVIHKRENMYTFGFINAFWVLFIFTLMVAIRGNFVFDFASIPLLILAAILEIAQIYSSLHAIVEADRSTMGFLMIGTVPLLLIVDMILGYPINTFIIIGISIIVLGVLILFLNHGINKEGLGYVLFATINAVATISIFKYSITHYNSVEAHQIIILVPLLIFLYFMSLWKHRENPLRYLIKKEFLIHPFSNGIGTVLLSLAFVYAPASVITSSKRASSIFWAIVTGKRYFHEKHILIKTLSFVLVMFGLVLLVISL